MIPLALVVLLACGLVVMGRRARPESREVVVSMLVCAVGALLVTFA